MPDSISFEDALANLQAMFPEWDKDTLEALLVSNDYHVERTIETVLTMSGDSNVYSQSQPISEPPAPVAAPREFPQPAPTSRNRGTKCNLPDDFLRSPAWEDNVIADEELAMMLQNELFRQEVRAMFGEDVVGEGSGNFNTSRRPSTGAGVARGGSSATGAADNTGDLGIVKAISSMGSAARRNLAQLAGRFQNNPRPRHTETGTAREFAPLMEMTGVEDDTEVISFDSHNSRSRHRLHGGGGRAEEEEEFNSENPLYMKAGTDTPAANFAKNKSV